MVDIEQKKAELKSEVDTHGYVWLDLWCDVTIAALKDLFDDDEHRLVFRLEKKPNDH